MSKESAKKFQQALESDSSLKNKFDDLMESIGKLSEKELKHKIVEFANKEGYDIDESDFKDNVFSGDSGELSEDELFNVAGGAYMDKQELTNSYVKCGDLSISDYCSHAGRAEFVRLMMN